MSANIEKSVASATLPELQEMADARKLFLQRVTLVHHWINGLFSSQIECPSSFRFRSDGLVMIGLKDGDHPLLRAYSIVSPDWEEHLEFFSVKVAEGPLTSRLQHLFERFFSEKSDDTG